MELLAAELHLRPDRDLSRVDQVRRRLLRGNGIVAARAAGGAVNVADGLCAENAVDDFGLRCHDGLHRAGMRPAGRDNEVGRGADGCHAKVDGLDALDNVIIVDVGGFDLVVADEQLGRGIGCAVLDRLDDEVAVRVVRGIVRVLDKRRFRRRRRLDNETGQNRVERQLCLLTRKGDFRARDGLLVGARIKHVAEDDGLALEQLEMRVHDFADRVGLPVVGIAQLLYRVFPVGAKHRGKERGRGFCGVDRCCADNERHTGFSDNGRRNARFLLPHIYAMLQWLLLLLSPVCQLVIIHIEQIAGCFDFDSCLGYLIAGDNQRGNQRIFLNRCRDLRERVLLVAVQNPRLLDRADDARPDVHTKAGAFRTGFAFGFYHANASLLTLGIFQTDTSSAQKYGAVLSV